MRFGLLFVVMALGCQTSVTGTGPATAGTNTSPGSSLPGTYDCQTVQSFTFSQPPDAVPSQRNYDSTVTITGTEGTFERQSTSNDAQASTAGCVLTFSGSDTSASLEDGQSCEAATNLGQFTVSMTSGSIVGSGGSLQGTLNGNVTGTLTASGASVRGTFHQVDTCTAR